MAPTLTEVSVPLVADPVARLTARAKATSVTTVIRRRATA